MTAEDQSAHGTVSTAPGRFRGDRQAGLTGQLTLTELAAAADTATDEHERLQLLHKIESRIDDEIRQAVTRARGAGLTWARIGSALGVSKQAGGTGAVHATRTGADSSGRTHPRRQAAGTSAGQGVDQRLGRGGAAGWPLQVLVVGGVGLLFIALALAAWTLHSGWRKARATADSWVAAGAVAGVAGYGTALLFHFTSPGPTTLAAVLGGLLLAEPTPANSPRPGRRRHATMTEAVAAGTCAVLSVVLFTGALAEVPLRRAVLSASRGELVEADAQFRTAARLRAWDVSIAETAGHAFAVISQIDPYRAPTLAEAWLDAAARRLPASSVVAVDQAVVADASGAYDQAISHWTHALTLDPNNPDILLGRGISYTHAGDFRSAERDFEATAAITPDSPEPGENLRRLQQLEQRLTLSAER